MEGKRKMKKSIILAFLLGAVAIPIILDRVIFSNCMYSNITNGEWASFLGSYIGGVCTLIAVFMTISDNNKKFKEQKDIQQEKEDEEKRLRVRPYLSTGFCDFKQEVNIQSSDRIIEMEAEIPKKMYYNLGNGRRMQIEHSDNQSLLCIDYKIRNIGAGSAVDMKIIINNIFPIPIVVAKDETIHIYFMVWTMHQDNVDIHIRLQYSDVESRGHYTKEDIIYSKKDIKNQTYISNIECGEIQYI